MFNYLLWTCVFVKYSLIGFGVLFVPILFLGAYVVSVRGKEYKTSDSATRARLLAIFSVLFAAGATVCVALWVQNNNESSGEALNVKEVRTG